MSGMFILGCGFIGLSYIQELWQFFAAFAVMALGLRVRLLPHGQHRS